MTPFELDATGFLAAMVRVAAWASTAPFIGDKTVPARLRMAAVAAIAFALAAVHPASPSTSIFAALPGELVLGLLSGFSVRLVIAGIEAGGQIIGNELGLGFAATYDPSVGDESLPTRRFAYALAGLAFLRTGGLEAAVSALSVPPLQPRSFADLIPSLVERGGLVYVAAIRLAAPILLASVITNLTMAIASRAAPALNVFSVMLALFFAVGTAVLLATAPAFAHEVEVASRLAGQAVAKVVTP